jgi:NitT/TauT family transport system permease protein
MENWRVSALGGKSLSSVAWGRAITLGLVAGLIVLWFLMPNAGVVDPIFLPTPQKTIHSLFKLLSFNSLQDDIFPSLFRISVAFAISVAVAFPLGVAGSQSPALMHVIRSVCGFMRYLPVAAFAPICILWFGIDDIQKMAVIAFGVVFQLTLLIAVDAASVPQELLEAGRTFGLSRRQLLKRIVLPCSMPAIWEDLRIGAGWAWSYLVLAELVAGNRGIGYYIVQSQRYLQTDRVFAAILLIGLLGLLTDSLFRFAGGSFFRWRDAN